MAEKGTAGYADIAAHFRKLIEDGDLQPGATMPPMSQVKDQFGVSITTVNRAFRLLKSEGLTTPRPGAETVVADRQGVAATAAARLERIARTGNAYAPGETSINHTSELRSCQDPMIAELLGVELGDEVIVRSRLFLRDGKPAVAALSVIHMRALAHVPELLQPQPFDRFWQEFYKERTGHQTTKSPERRTARHASSNELDLLDVHVPEGAAVPVLVLVNTFHDDEGPLEVWEDVYAPGLWQVEGVKP
ncbi:GntR family transcriptional regulator [Streptomyces sp. SID8379]|uniref:GntR family transcriptional regulator n=1 Tax=unclassified Streptomyces TaxID=2593676 RepID=UPI0003651C7F|nr:MULTISPECIES: GntR family transcriptional regulator [unclassified Streptomyces]MYW66293.1 GntR family transcriptional regulator [Streptomyces sp. SID8379]